MSSTSIETLVTEYNKTKKEFISKSQDVMKLAFKEFFEANPDINQVAWTQYTPYFNDGDVCEFGVSDIYFTLAKDEVDLGEADYLGDEDTHYSECSSGPDVKKHARAFKTFTDEIRQLPEDIYLNTFGDHVKVVANKDGFDVQEYEHD